MSNAPHGLDDPQSARLAWARFRTTMYWMAGIAVAFIVVAIIVLEYVYGPLSFVAILAAVGGFGGSILLAGALMGLVFLSSGSGHDEDVDRRR